MAVPDTVSINFFLKKTYTFRVCNQSNEINHSGKNYILIFSQNAQMYMWNIYETIYCKTVCKEIKCLSERHNLSKSEKIALV